MESPAITGNIIYCLYKLYSMYFVCIGVIGDFGCFHVQGCTKNIHQSQGVDLLKAIIHQGDPESDEGSNNNLP